MRMITGLAVAALLTICASTQADDAVAAKKSQIQAKPAQAQKIETVQKKQIQTVSSGQQQAQNVCPRCGKVHAQQAAPARRVQRQENVFGQIMELERRKNAWLRSLFR